MINFKHQIKLFTINNDNKIGDAIEKINENKMKTVFVINSKNNKYIGSITDGDIRRGIIKNYSKNNSVMKIVNKKSIYFIYTLILVKTRWADISKRNDCNLKH